MIKFEKVNFKYYKNLILKDVTFTTPKNGIVCIIGENGSGKSTLINQIDNKNKYKGNIYIGGKNINSYSNKEIPKMISYLPQKIFFPEEITAWDVIKIGRNPYTNIWGMLSKEDKTIINKYAKITGVDKFIHMGFNNLSGGQQQRVILTMSLCQETEILILDEPTNHLDVKYQIEFFNLIKSIKHEKLIILTTHNINMASKYADEIILLKQGSIIETGKKTILNEKNIVKLFDVKSKFIKVNNAPIIVDMEI